MQNNQKEKERLLTELRPKLRKEGREAYEKEERLAQRTKFLQQDFDEYDDVYKALS